MIESLIMLLIWVLVAALVIYVAIWAISQIAGPLPAPAVKIIWVIFAIIVLLWAVQTVGVVPAD